jgi:hypothetical protein
MHNVRSLLIVSAILAAICAATALAGPRPRIPTIERRCCDQPDPAIRTLEYAVVEVLADGAVTLNGATVRVTALSANIRRLAMRHPIVLFTPHAEAPYHRVVEALKGIDAAGVLPSRICLEPLGRFRIHESDPFEQGETEILPRAQEASGLPEIAPGNCATLVQMPPLY